MKKILCSCFVFMASLSSYVYAEDSTFPFSVNHGDMCTEELQGQTSINGLVCMKDSLKPYPYWHAKGNEPAPVEIKGLSASLVQCSNPTYRLEIRKVLADNQSFVLLFKAGTGEVLAGGYGRETPETPTEGTVAILDSNAVTIGAASFKGARYSLLLREPGGPSATVHVTTWNVAEQCR